MSLSHTPINSQIFHLRRESFPKGSEGDKLYRDLSARFREISSAFDRLQIAMNAMPAVEFTKLEELTSIATDDVFLIYDTSTKEFKKIQRSNL